MKGKPIKYSKVELAFIKRNKVLPRKELTQKFNKKFSRNVSQENLTALCKRNNWKTGRTGKFKKGRKPFNYGLKGVNGKSSTTFKKGNIPKSHKPVGTQRLSKDGYLEAKIKEPNVWEALHTSLWKKEVGDPKEGFAIVFKDGNKRNITIDNLEEISRGELLARNRMGYQNCPDDFKPACATMVKMKVKIYEKQRQ